MAKLAVLIAVLVLVVVVAAAQLAPTAQPEDQQIARGKYLVERVAVCQECHTARLETGQLDRSRWLQGTDLDFKPVKPFPAWAPYATPVAGLPTMSVEEGVHYFETGTRLNGKPSRPPMPQYKLTHEDAVAMTAYLKSLKSSDTDEGDKGQE